MKKHSVFKNLMAVFLVVMLSVSSLPIGAIVADSDEAVVLNEFNGETPKAGAIDSSEAALDTEITEGEDTTPKALEGEGKSSDLVAMPLQAQSGNMAIRKYWNLNLPVAPPLPPMIPERLPTGTYLRGMTEAQAEGIFVDIYKSGVKVDEVFLSPENDWMKVSNIKAREFMPEALQYSIKERGETNGYMTYGGKTYKVTYLPSDYGFDVINNEVDLQKIRVTKVWGEAGDTGGDTSTNTADKFFVGGTYLKGMTVSYFEKYRPESVNVILYKNENEFVQEITLRKESGWTGEFTVEKDPNVVYTVKERDENFGVVSYLGSKYNVSYSGDAENGFVIKNDLRLKKIGVRKIWSTGGGDTGGDTSTNTADKALPGIHHLRNLFALKASEPLPESVSIALQEDGVDRETLVLNQANNWAGQFVVVDMVNPPSYSIREIDESDGYITFDDKTYSVTISGDDTSGFIVKNTLEKNPPVLASSGRIKVEKIWDLTELPEATLPESVYMQLEEKDKATGEYRAIEGLNLDARSGWKGEFKATIKEDSEYRVTEQGELGGRYTYYVQNPNKNAPDLYICKVTYKESLDDRGNKLFTVTNKPRKTKEVRITKKWNDLTTISSRQLNSIPQNAGYHDSLERGTWGLTQECGITVTALNKDDVFLASVRLTPTNGWSDTITVEDDPNLGLKLKEEHEINGVVHLYRDYEMTYSGDLDNGYVVTNTERPIKVTKKINGNLDTLQIAPEKDFTYNIKAELPYLVEGYEMFELFDVLDERVVLQEGKLPEILGEAKNFFEVTVDGQEVKARIKDFRAASEFVREALEGGTERVVELVIPVKLKAGVTSTVSNEVILTYEHPTFCGSTMLTGRVTPPPVTVTPPGNPPGGSTLIPPPPTTDKPPVPTVPTPPPVVVPPEEIPVEPIPEVPNKPKTPKKKGKVLPKTGLSESNALGLSLSVLALAGTVMLFRRKED